MAENPGREALKRWRSSKPDNLYDADRNLEHVITALVDKHEVERLRPSLRAFGAVVACGIDPLVDACERLENLPLLRKWSGVGERTEEIEFHPAYKEAGRKIWASGIVACRAEPGHALEQACLFYLLAQVGEGGHCCPIACTTGLVRALQLHATAELRERFLPPLLEQNYDRAHIGAQFLTEVQGGSDVGANIVQARPEAQRDGVWRISGEKWFCSVANADQFLITARVEDAGTGTAGLGTFLVPRRLEDGSLNEFSIRRLKTKLGTRAMASGEIDFQGAEAYAIGQPREGFKIAVGIVLNTSRWMNALASCGVMQRCYLEALRFASLREAFGGPIARFPLIREALAMMRCEQAAALASTLYLTRLIDRMDLGLATEHEHAIYRFLVNANKYITSVAASDVTRMAVEILGGNGTIEDFSPIPRLLRDNVVYESWEGTHNVLVAQVLRDSTHLGLTSNLHDEIRTQIDSIQTDRLRGETPVLAETLSAVTARAGRSFTDADFGAAHFRRQLTTLIRVFQAVRLLVEADRELSSNVKSDKAEMAAFYIRRHLTPAYDCEQDPQWRTRIDRLSSCAAADL